MDSASLHVVIVGGGIGGLCLAQGLKRSGVSVAVYERDHSPTSRLQGYRLHINPAGSRALHVCLPPELYDTFVATCGKAGRGFNFLTDQMEELLYLGAPASAGPTDPVESHKSVSRITLRQVLLSGLDDIVHFGKTFVRYEERPDGAVTVWFEDGSSATGDVLVAADGAGSRLRRQFLPHAERVDTGVVAIGGKAPLTDDVRRLLPAHLFDGPALVLAPGGINMFVAVQEFAHEPAAVGAIGRSDWSAGPAPGLLLDNTADYVMWALSARREKYARAGDLDTLDARQLQQLVLDQIAGWHPRFHALVHQTDLSTLLLVPISTSIPIEHWPTRRITLLGDAIHSMTPFRGIGANVALRDASLLCRSLVAAQHGEQPLLEAIHDYEVEMIRYGFDAVRSSKRALDQAVSENPIALALMKTVLRIVGAVPAMSAWMFRKFGNE